MLMRTIKKLILTFFGALAILVLGLMTFYYSQGPAHEGLKPADFADKEFDINEIVSVKAVADKPNIVFILADDLGYGDVSYNKDTVIQTPNLDRLAKEGVVFSQFYAPASICSPSRLGFLTGRYAIRQGLAYPFHHITNNFFINVGNRLVNFLGAVDMRGEHNIINGIMESELTIPELLKLANYKSGVVGKWHLGTISHDEKFHPFYHGFDYFVGLEASNDDWPVAFYKNKTKVLDDIGLDQEHYTQLFTDAAITFIKENKDNPFFIYIAHKDPHQPFFPSKKFKGKSKAGAYGDAVEEFDHSVGQVLDLLDDLKLSHNTIVVVTSDNGPWFEGHAHHLRGRKGQMYEGGYKVPFIMRYPKKIQKPIKTNVPGTGVDLLPTFIAEAGVSLPKDRKYDGHNLFEILNDTSTNSIGYKRPIYFFHDFSFEAVRIGDWKYIEANNSYNWPIPLENPKYITREYVPKYSPENSDVSVYRLDDWPKLYNVKESPHESYNLSTRHVKVKEELAQTLKEFREDFLKNPRGWVE